MSDNRQSLADLAALTGAAPAAPPPAADAPAYTSDEAPAAPTPVVSTMPLRELAVKWQFIRTELKVRAVESEPAPRMRRTLHRPGVQPCFLKPSAANTAVPLPPTPSARRPPGHH